MGIGGAATSYGAQPRPLRALNRERQSTGAYMRPQVDHIAGADHAPHIPFRTGIARASFPKGRSRAFLATPGSHNGRVHFRPVSSFVGATSLSARSTPCRGLFIRTAVEGFCMPRIGTQDLDRSRLNFDASESLLLGGSDDSARDGADAFHAHRYGGVGVQGVAKNKQGFARVYS